MIYIYFLYSIVFLLLSSPPILLLPLVQFFTFTYTSYYSVYVKVKNYNVKSYYITNNNVK